MVLLAHEALTPAGNPLAPATPALEIPVATVVVWVIFVKAVLIHTVGVVEAAPAVFVGLTVMVPVAFTTPQPPVNGMLYGKVPETVGVPLIVMTLLAQLAVTPVGSPVGAPIPVASVVANVIFVNAVLIHTVGELAADPAVLVTELEVTLMVPVA